jgi:competence protein ComEC
MFHFKNFSTYSLLTNLLAIPITEFIIMPFEMLAIFLIPVKLEFIGYYPMEKGIEVLLYISNTIAFFPSAVINVYNVNAHSILCFVVGCLILMLIKTKLKYIAIFCFIALIINIVNFRLPDIVISKNTKLIAVKDLQDNQLYLIRGFRERYSKKVWQKELNIKAISKKYLREICNQDYCYIPDQKLLILFEEKYNKKFIDICNEIDIKVIVNFTNLYYECSNVILNLNKANFDLDGTHLIYKVKNNYKIITEKDHVVKKPWNKDFFN